VRVISAVIAFCLTGEILLITVQSARGVASHFNRATVFDGVVFTTMGVLIGINTLAAIAALVTFSTRPVTAPPALRTGIRLGLFILVLASLEGLVARPPAGGGGPALDGGLRRRLPGGLGAAHRAGPRRPAADRCRPLTTSPARRDRSSGVTTVSLLITG
jgi:hypothetical protein